MSAPARADLPAQVPPRAAIVAKFNEFKPVMRKLLARTATSEETFVAQIGNAMRSTPKLWSCEPETVLGAALRCAQLDMPPNDDTNRTWIIPYGKVAQFQLGYGGVLELARRAQPGLIFDGHTVYEGDIFDLDYGRTEQPLKHKPAASRRPPKPRGQAVAWYVRVEYPDGRTRVHMLDREGVEYHRSFSKQPDGEMWSKSYDAAALKSVVLDMRRWLPASPQLAQAIAADEQVHDVRTMNAGEITHTRDESRGDDASSEGAEPETPDDEDARWVAEARGEPT